MGRAANGFYLAVFSLLCNTSTVHTRTTNAGSAAYESCAIDPRTIVSDACASFSTLDDLNTRLKPSIQSLTKDSDFFSYYRLNLYNKICPFWSDENGLCSNIACAVNTIDNEEDVPPIWRAEELGKLEGPKAQHPNRKMQAERESRPLQGELGANVGESCVVEYDDECDERDYCVPEDESAAGKGDYVSLVDNPERFTGYSGPGAQQVWEAIYRENCFSKDAASLKSSSWNPTSPFGFSGQQAEAAHGLRSVMREHERQQLRSSDPPMDLAVERLELDDECLEKRVFYRVISGMHASISMHLCWDHLNQTTGQWGPNTQCYQDRLRGYSDRVSNLYFNYALVLRAIAKARKSFESYTFCSGDLDQDRLTKHKVLALADKISTGPNIYDESLMFQDSSVVGLKEDFRSRFRNVSRTMDCVGCDKCRLWGKLQTAGYGTALKILFEFDENDNSQNPPLRRTELVALVNTLDKLSHSLSALGHFEDMLGDKGEHNASRGIVEDDGLKDDKKNEPPGVMDDFWQEVDIIWRTFKWVLRRWYNLPKDLLTIAAWELGRFWQGYIGFTMPDRTWGLRPPLKEEI